MERYKDSRYKGRQEENRAAFQCLYRQGFARVAACTLPVRLADPLANAEAMLSVWRSCASDGVAIAAFPELGLVGYSIEDLLFQQVVLDHVEQAVAWLLEESRDLMTVGIIGGPVRYEGALYNCAVILHHGAILGIVPKTILPRYREFYETRHFSSGAGCSGMARFAGQEVPFGTDLLFTATDIENLTFGVEICEDLWAPDSPGTRQAIEGATILANLSASPVTVGRAADRHLLCAAQSLKTVSAYLYAAAGIGESTTDLSWDGQLTIHENGRLLSESSRFLSGPTSLVADIDLQLLAQERMRLGYFSVGRKTFRRQFFTLSPEIRDRGLKREVLRFPFVPHRIEALAQDCQEAWEIQVQALCQRLRSCGAEKMVIGVSGGLDSALALLVAVRAADAMNWPRHHVLARTMPGFATGEESLSYARELMESLSVDAGLLDIRPTARAMLEEIGHPSAQGEAVYDVTFENVQAGLRTDFLFRLANRYKGIVIGTGDMSELALGWCTYGVGDQMAHYNVNAGLPKTLIQHVIRWAAKKEAGFSPGCRAVLERIVTAEISPELVPHQEGQVQSTEAVIGPYDLQDFTLFYVLRYGFSPRRIAFLQEKAWGDVNAGIWPAHYPAARRRAYSREEIVTWMRLFMQRFFAFSQFKRSAMPNGPKVVAGGSLSPRGDWRAPSDGNAHLWLQDIKNIPL